MQIGDKSGDNFRDSFREAPKSKGPFKPFGGASRDVPKMPIELPPQVERIESERKQELDQLRAEWKASCTDKCHLCR